VRPSAFFWELRHVGLICMADRWAWSPLAARVALVACGSELFVTFGTSRMISGAVHEQLSLCLFDSINSRVPGINSPIQPFPFLVFALPAALAFSPENGPW
jgi:hypothetical protein